MKTFPHSAEFAAKANSNPQKYADTYQESVDNNEAFWAKRAELVDWIKKPTQIKNVSRTEPRIFCCLRPTITTSRS